eukprot:gene17358-19092_t
MNDFSPKSSLNKTQQPVVTTKTPLSKNNVMSQIRYQISRGKVRHVDDALDLDLTYITDRIIAMSFPASGLDAAYRNSSIDIAIMLQEKHGNNYRVFNVSERRYDISKLNNQVLDLGWPDHLAPPLERLISIINSIDSWLSADDHNVAVVHCKGGKNRTGVVISAYIQFNKFCPSPQAALDWFALRRYYDAKFGGVTQPSQKRVMFLKHIIIHGIPNFDGKGGCRPFARIYQGYQLVHTSPVYVANSKSDSIVMNFHRLALSGDIMVKCCQKGSIPALQDTVFRCQFNIDAVNEFRLVLQKKDLDEAYKDRRFPSCCSVEFIFAPEKGDEISSQEKHLTAAFNSLISELDQEDLFSSPMQTTSTFEGRTHLMKSGSDYDQGILISKPERESGSHETEHSSARIVHLEDNSFKGLQKCHMASPSQHEGCVKSFAAPNHIPGPINGNPYALVDRTLFSKTKSNRNNNKSKMMHQSQSPKSFDLSKGINDLDNLLSDLGFLTSSCKNETSKSTMMNRDENHNIQHDGNNENKTASHQTTITSKLPTINVVGTEAITKSASVCYHEPSGRHEKEAPQKPSLPARTSSFGAVGRHHHNHRSGSLGRSDSSENGYSLADSPGNPHPKVYQSQSSESDDVFRVDGPVSPTVAEMLNELSQSPLSTESNYWRNKRTRHFTTKYDNDSESAASELSCDKTANADGAGGDGEFYQGRVRDHVKQFNRILSAPDPSKVGTGVPMPGLVQGIDFEEKISKFNYRSLAPGQCGPVPERLYMAGGPPKKIIYEADEEEHVPVEATVNETKADEALFIPCYADRPAAYYLNEHEKAKKRGMKLSNGNIHHHNHHQHSYHQDARSEEIASNEPQLHNNNHLFIENPCEIIINNNKPRARAGSDSAYEDSIRSSSVASTSLASTTQPKCPRNELSKSSGRGSHTSSITSFDDEDSSGYARIEDFPLVKEKAKKSPSPTMIESKGVIEDEVIAVSHTLPQQCLPSRLNKQLPEIKSKKDLSLAVYQTNYLPGLTNGQPTVLSSSQIDIEDESFQSEATSPAVSPAQDKAYLTLNR